MAQFGARFSSPISTTGSLSQRHGRDGTDRDLGTGSRSCSAIPFSILSAAISARNGSCSRSRRLNGRLPRDQRDRLCADVRGGVGLGPFAGDGAVHPQSRGVLQLFSEAVEAIDPRPVEGIRRPGAAPLQRSCSGGCRKVMPV